MARKVPVLVLVAGLALGASGCELNKKVSKQAKERAAADEDGKQPQRIASATGTAPGRGAAGVQEAVILVEGIYGNRQTRATGVIFEAEDGLALTANHAIEAAPAIVATQADGTLHRARVIARAQCHDLAVLRLSPPPKGVRAVPFAPPSSVRIGEPTTTLSYVLGAGTSETPRLAFTKGTVSAINVSETFTPLPPMSPLISHQTPLTPLGSGSPLLNDRGQLIGINTLVGHPRKDPLPGIEYALSSDYIRKRLRELTPGPSGTLGGWQSEHNACHHALNQLIGAGHTHEGAAAPTGGSSTGGGTGHGSGGGTGGGHP